MINTGIFFTPERAAMMQMIPYEDQAISVSVATDNETVKTKEDLAGMRIGVEIGGFEETKTGSRRGAEGVGLRKVWQSRPSTILRWLSGAACRSGPGCGGVNRRGGKRIDSRGDFRRAVSGLYPAPVAVAFKSVALWMQYRRCCRR